MPVLIPGGSGPRLFTTTTTAQTVMDAVSQDIRNQLSSSKTPDSDVLLDYVNRASLDILKLSKWWFLLSSVQQFITQRGVTNYWIGPTGSAVAGSWDTGLNLTDVRYIKPKSVVDRTNYRPLGSINEQPLSAKLSYADATQRPGRPAVYRQDESTPNVLNIYPAADNQAFYSPQPQSPICTHTAGGSLPARLYFVTVTFVDSLGGESTAPYATQVYVPANNLLVVNPPVEPVATGATGIAYDRYNVYASSVGQSESTYIYFQQTTQQATNISTAAAWTEPGSGLTTNGSNPPSVNGVEPIEGYIIEFRYYRQIIQVTDPGQILQLPDDYKHVIIAGVNALAFQFLFRAPEAQMWEMRYRDGCAKIVRDLNFMSKVGDYFGPDASSVGGFLPTVETTDLSLLTP